MILPTHPLRLLCLLVPAIAASPGAAGEAKRPAEVHFGRDIRPILSDKCFHCHGPDEMSRQADFRLDVREDALSVIDLEDADSSELLTRIRSSELDEIMPPPNSHKAPLSRDEIDLIERWIGAGAEYQQHWAFVPPQAAKFDDPRRSLSDQIDILVAQVRRANGLTASVAVEPTKWLRRASLTLTGLPPTLDQLIQFETDVEQRGEAAYEHAVDCLLDSTDYAERMALEWMDVARYADTNGYQQDAYRMNWPWRDWVVDAFDKNMPFDQFSIRQIAGDLLPDATPSDRLATGFNRNHMINGEGGVIAEEAFTKTVFDRVETTATTWLGLTMNCCQCHDHKFDPLRQRDYYAMSALFNRTGETATADKRMTVKDDSLGIDRVYWMDSPVMAHGTDAEMQRVETLRVKVERLEADLESNREQFFPEIVSWVENLRSHPDQQEAAVPDTSKRKHIESAKLDDVSDNGTIQLTKYYLANHDPWRELVAGISEAKNELALAQLNSPLVMVMSDQQPRPTFILERGSYELPGDRVSAALPKFLVEQSDGEQNGPKREIDRLDFARWLFDEENPLTSRVIINRYWQLVFGHGIVATPDDFGLQGAYPTHPILLDHLAVRFRADNWDLKRLLRAMVLSETFRQTSNVSKERFLADSENTFLTRGPSFRLDSRLIRDHALAISGLLDKQIGGPPVFPYQPDGVWEAVSLGKNHYEAIRDGDAHRRSLYTVWRRVVGPTGFFDTTSRQTCAVKRRETNTPMHALVTMNDPTFVEASRVWAERAFDRPERDMLFDAFFRATGRRAGDAEFEVLKQVHAEHLRHFRQHPEDAKRLLRIGLSPVSGRLTPEQHAAWTLTLQMTLNLDEALRQ